MPECHAEPYLQLAGLSHKSALVSWGAFYCKWSGNAHFLLVTIDGDQMRVRPFGELVDGELAELARFLPSGEKATDPIIIAR